MDSPSDSLPTSAASRPADWPAAADRRDLPFFIVGNPRSGTTLLRFILSSHSRIYIPEETGFVPHLAHLAKRPLNRPQVQELVEQIGQMNREWRGIVADYEAFFQSLPSPTTLHDALDALYHVRIAPQGAVRWGDKGPSYVRWIPQLEQIFPESLYIHLVRDGRDCTLSSLKKWSADNWHYDTYYLMRTWQRNVEAGQQAARQLGPQRFLEVRYEALVGDPAATTRQICDFLGETFEPAMLDHTPLAKQLIAPTGHFEVERPVTQASVENWRKRMSEFDQKLAVRLCGSTLRSLGYALPDLPPMTTRESLRYAKLAAKFQATDNARRLLYAVGWLKMSRYKAS
jgi:LPS sulfotransferase NodH